MKPMILTALIAVSAAVAVMAPPPPAGAVQFTVGGFAPSPAFVRPGRFDYTVIDVERAADRAGLGDLAAPAPSIDNAGGVLWRDEGAADQLIYTAADGASSVVFTEAPGLLRLSDTSFAVSEENRFVAFEARDASAVNSVFVAQVGGLPVRVAGAGIEATILFGDDRPLTEGLVTCNGRCGISNIGRAGFLVDRQNITAPFRAAGVAGATSYTAVFPEVSLADQPVSIISGAPYYVYDFNTLNFGPPFENQELNAQAFEFILLPEFGIGDAKVGDYALVPGERRVAVVIEPNDGDTRPTLFLARKDEPGILAGETFGPLATLENPSANKAGTVVYSASFDIAPGGAQVVLDGPSVTSDRVLGPGSTLFGERVIDVFVKDGDALNASGAIALTAITETPDGGFARYVLRADPPAGSRLLVVDQSALLVANLDFGAATLSQTIAPIADPFSLSFSLNWLGGDGLLQLLLNGDALGEFSPGDDGIWLVEDIAPPPTGAEIEIGFALTGDASVRIDDVIVAGLMNGDFEEGDLAGWRSEGFVFAEASSFAAVPLPGAGGLLALGLVGLIGGARPWRARRRVT